MGVCVKEKLLLARACVCVQLFTHLYLSHTNRRAEREKLSNQVLQEKKKKKRQEEKQNVFDGVEAEKFKIKEKKKSRVKSVE